MSAIGPGCARCHVSSSICNRSRSASSAASGVVAGRAAHTSKGAASNLGATRVVAAARIIEESCQVAGAVDDEALVVLDNALIEAGLALRALQS